MHYSIDLVLVVDQIDQTWALPLVVALIMFAALFVQAASGATYARVPLVKQEIIGQVAGNVGAY